MRLWTGPVYVLYRHIHPLPCAAAVSNVSKMQTYDYKLKPVITVPADRQEPNDAGPTTGTVLEWLDPYGLWTNFEIDTDVYHVYNY